MNHLSKVLLFSVVFACASGVTFAEKLVIKGSTTVLPIAQKVSEAYMRENPSVKISLSGGGSGNGIKAIIDNTTHIANASRFIKNKEIRLALKNGTFPVAFRIAYDCIIPIVHPSNSIRNITTKQLKDIYMGKIRNWKRVGGADRKIVVVSRDTSSGTYEVWHKKVMRKKRVYPGALLQASNGAVSQAIAKNRYAIGYVGIGYLNSAIKPLSVNGIVGSKRTTLDGTFPISRPLFMFTRGWPEGKIIAFLNFMLHPKKGQKLVEKSGYVPLY